MESKDKIRKLIKIDEATGEKYTVYPITYIQAIIDENGNRNLDDILASYNTIYVEFNKDFATTMKVVPEVLRTKGRQVTYIVQGESAKAATFVYNSNKVTDEEFCNVDNWITLTGGDINLVTNEIASVTNNPDNLDIVTVNEKLQLGDGTTVSGTNLYILRPKDINADNLELDDVSIEVLKKPNILCVVKYDFVATNKDSINVGAKSGLLFAGGTMTGFVFNVIEPYKIIGHYDLVKFLANNTFNEEPNLIFDGQFNLGNSDIQQIEGTSWKRQAALGKIIYNKDEDKLRAFTKEKVFSITENNEYLIPSTELNFNFITDGKACTRKEDEELSKIRSKFNTSMRTKFYFYDSGTSSSGSTNNRGYYQVWVTRDGNNPSKITFQIPFYDGTIKVYSITGGYNNLWYVYTILPVDVPTDRKPVGSVVQMNGGIPIFKGNDEQLFDSDGNKYVYGYLGHYPKTKVQEIEITDDADYTGIFEFKNSITEWFIDNAVGGTVSEFTRIDEILTQDAETFIFKLINIDDYTKDSNEEFTLETIKNIRTYIVKCITDPKDNSFVDIFDNLYSAKLYEDTVESSDTESIIRRCYYNLKFEFNHSDRNHGQYKCYLDFTIRFNKYKYINYKNNRYKPVDMEFKGNLFITKYSSLDKIELKEKYLTMQQYNLLTEIDPYTKYFITN